MSDADFVYRDLPVVKKRVHRLGLAFNFGIDPAGVEAGLEGGINYLFWAKFRKGPEHEVIKAALKRDRERYVLASGAAFGFFGGSVRRGAEKLLRFFDIEYVDIFHIFWLGRMSAFTKGVRVPPMMTALLLLFFFVAIGFSCFDLGAKKHAAACTNDLSGRSRSAWRR